MDPIRLPTDEVDTHGFFYPPFRAGWTYEGVTYGGHSDFAVDFNRRLILPGGTVKWVQDAGDPVLAAAKGTVAEVDKADGVVMINHAKGLKRTEYRHMTGIVVKVGDKVERGQRIGSIGAVGISADSGFPVSAHLHHRHWSRESTDKDFEPTKMELLGEPVAASVWNSDSRPKSWDAPGPIYVVGQPLPATWQGAYREAAKRLKASEKLVAARDAEIVALKAALEAAGTPWDASDTLEHARQVVAALEAYEELQG